MNGVDRFHSILKKKLKEKKEIIITIIKCKKKDRRKKTKIHFYQNPLPEAGESTLK